MANKQVNWEKVGVYLAIGAAFLTVIIYLFQIKDDITMVRERMKSVEVKIEHLESK